MGGFVRTHGRVRVDVDPRGSGGGRERPAQYFIPEASGGAMKFSLLILLLAGLGACSPPPAAHTPQAGAGDAPVAVRAERLAERTWPVTQEAMGTVEARARALLAAQVTGVVRQVNAEAGQAVRAGQVLITLEAREWQTTVQQAEASRTEALSAGPEVEKAIEAARAQAELAQTSHRRMEELFAKKSASPQERDEAEARLRGARAALEQAVARRGAVNARAGTAAAAIEAAKVMAGYTVITAPFDGLVTEKLTQAGSLATPGAPLLVVERAGGYQFVITAQESTPLRLGQALTITWEDGTETAARVSEIAPAVDAATRTQTAKAVLPTMSGLRSGRFARARWQTGERAALTIPAGALVQRGQLQLVLAVENGRLRSRMITAGEAQGGRREVLSGLQAGELVVVAPPAEWRDGAAARVEERP